MMVTAVYARVWIYYYGEMKKKKKESFGIAHKIHILQYSAIFSSSISRLNRMIIITAADSSLFENHFC